LVGYGIQTDGSHYRAHVGYVAQHVYIFPTKNGLRALEEYDYMERSVKTRDIETARGFAVPISHIEGIQEILIPLVVLAKYMIESYFATGIKGGLATEMVAEMLRRGLIPLPVLANLADGIDLQIAGTDIIIASSLHMQVKLDYKAGDRKYGGTGNLFLQVAECNPFRQY